MGPRTVDDLVVGATDDLRIALAALVLARDLAVNRARGWPTVLDSLRLASRHVASGAAKLTLITREKNHEPE